MTTWLRRWQDRLPTEDTGMPQDEARLVVEAVLEDIAGGRGENLDRAGRAWGRAHRSVAEMVGRLSSFREALAASGVDDALRMHRALDRVTAAATEEVLHRLERASRTDALTGVGNRRAFDETLSAALSAAARQGHEVTVVAVDLDGLKRINDTEGHAAGDGALMALVRSFYVALRDEDTVFRVGGDEFVILLPFTSVSAAEVLMERIHASGAPAFTWGAAGYPGDGADALAVVAAADHDLYRRRQARRAEPPERARRPVMASLRADSQPQLIRWAWAPAAAVLVASLVATLLSTAGVTTLAKGPSSSKPPVTRPRGGHGSTGHAATTAPGLGAGAGGSGLGLGSTGVPVLTAAFSPSLGAPASSQGGSTGSGSGSSSGSGSTTPPSSTSPGGLLGTVSGILGPLPLLGGTSDELVAVVADVLTGPTTTVTSTATPDTASSASTPATSLTGAVTTVTSTITGILDQLAG